MLPVVTTHDQDLVGRDPEVARVTELLATNRLVTVVGPAGVRKSALAAALRQGSQAPTAGAATASLNEKSHAP